MLLFKFIGILCVLAGTTGLGISICEEIKGRVQCLKEERTMLELLKNEVKYNNASLEEACKSVSGKLEGIFLNLLLAVEENCVLWSGKRFSDNWVLGVCKIEDKLLMKKEEKEALKKLFGIGGFADVSMQQRIIESAIEELNRSIESAEAEKKNRCKVSLCVCVMSGILCTIVCI